MSDAELDRLIDMQATELKDRARRTQLLLEIQRKIIDLAGIISAYRIVTQDAYQPYVRDFFRGYNAEPTYYEHIWLDR